MSEKKDIREVEDSNVAKYNDGNITAAGFAIDSDELPQGYFLRPRFLGTFCAVGMNLLSSTGGFALIAPVLGDIDVALSPPGQPSPAITWLALVYSALRAYKPHLRQVTPNDLSLRRMLLIC